MNSTPRKKRRRKITFSQGEKKCYAELQGMGLQPLRQRVIAPLPKYRFDFAFGFQGRSYLLEFDGDQHFTFSKFIQRRYSSFVSNRKRDIVKTLAALFLGFYVIRLDGSSLGEGSYRHAIQTGIASGQRLYVSHPERYRWLLEHEVSEEDIRLYGGTLADTILRTR